MRELLAGDRRKSAGLTRARLPDRQGSSTFGFDRDATFVLEPDQEIWIRTETVGMSQSRYFDPWDYTLEELTKKLRGYLHVCVETLSNRDLLISRHPMDDPHNPRSIHDDYNSSHHLSHRLSGNPKKHLVIRGPRVDPDQSVQSYDSRYLPWSEEQELFRVGILDLETRHVGLAHFGRDLARAMMRARNVPPPP